MELGFNCVRLPFSLEMWFDNPKITIRTVSGDTGLAALAASPTGLDAKTLFDHSVHAMADAGLLIVLNNHNSASGWCCDVNSEEGLWTTTDYPVAMWLDALGNITARYASVPQIVGFDLRNEIHDAAPYDRLITWGVNESLDTDWKAASEAGARVVHAANPDVLIIVAVACRG